jgi:hypothetical protein
MMSPITGNGDAQRKELFMSPRRKIAAVLAGSAVVLGAAGAAAITHPGNLWQSPASSEQSADGPDAPGVPDMPEPGDTPDAGD